MGNIEVLKWLNFFSGFRLFSGIAILYFTHVTGSFALGMSIFSVATISSALSELPTGIFSDRIGRRKTVIYGTIFSVLSLVLYAVGISYWFLFIGAVMEGVSTAFFSGNNDALLYDTLAVQKKEHEYSEHLGKINSTEQSALAIAGVLGGFIAIFSFQLIMWISVIPQIICLVLVFRLHEVKEVKKESTNIYFHLKEAFLNFVRNRNLRLLSIASMLGYAVGEASFQFQAAFYNTLWPIWAIGIAKTFSFIGGSASFYISGKFIKKYTALRLLLASNIYNRIIGIVSVVFPSFISPILMTSTSLLYGISSVSKNTLMQKEFKHEQRATMGSLNSFGGSILFGIFALLLGFAADQLSPAKALLYSQFLLFPVMGIYFFLFKKDKNLV
jgi:MFS family permease